MGFSGDPVQRPGQFLMSSPDQIAVSPDSPGETVIVVATGISRDPEE
jgi:hypothetical protein